MPNDGTSWTRLVIDSLETLQRTQAGAAAAVVDHEVVGAPDGGAEGIAVWLICRNRSERLAFADTELSRYRAELSRRLLAAGFPEEALTGLAVRVTSRDDIAARGGRIGGL